MANARLGSKDCDTLKPDRRSQESAIIECNDCATKPLLSPDDREARGGSRALARFSRVASEIIWKLDPFHVLEGQEQVGSRRPEKLCHPRGATCLRSEERRVGKAGGGTCRSRG